MDFADIREYLIGLQSCYIKVGYGSKLRIGLGNKIFYNIPRLKRKYYGEWDISSHFCGWRVLKDNVVICGYDSEIKDSNEILKSIEPGSLKDIFHINKFDIRLTFDKNISIDFLCQSTDEPILIILGDSKKVSFELTQTGWVQSSSDEQTQKMTAIEATLNSHSDECHNRWRKIVYESDTEDNCEDCFYFRGIYGGFYFWDYGLCSNKESKFDGKLVSTKSGCDRFNILSNIIE